MWRTVCVSHVHCKFLQLRSVCAFMTRKADAEQESILQRCTDVYISEGDVLEDSRGRGLFLTKELNRNAKGT